MAKHRRSQKRFVSDDAPEQAQHWIRRGEQLGDALLAGVALLSALLILVSATTSREKALER